MTNLLTTGPISIAYDDPRTNTRQGRGATAVLIAALGEPTPEDSDPCIVHMIGSQRNHVYLVAASLATLAKDYGEEAAETAIKAARILYNTQSAWKSSLRIDPDQPPAKGQDE